jgi:radical SAM protein with 4Fe4S-binding SPASM domain
MSENKNIDNQIWKQKFNSDLAEFRKEAYKVDEIMPKRYCLVLTNLCNLACDFCYQVRTKQKNFVDSEGWIKLIKDLPTGSRVTLTGGEPLVFKNFKDVFLETVKRHECNLICNGLLLSEEIIDLLLSQKNFKVLSISIDNRNNTIRKLANVNEKKWDEKWAHAEKMMKYFQKRKKELNHPKCVLDSKTVVLDENAKDLLDIHKYCIEDLNCDTHSFQFLKGSPILGCDYMFKFDEIFDKSKAYKYKNWQDIKDQLNLVKKYNFKNQTVGFLHPKVDELIGNDEPLDEKKLDMLNEEEHKKENFQPCAQPWSSVHINVDGTVFPCLAVSMGNIQEKNIKEIIFDDQFKKFKKILKKDGTVEACNRCGWLQLSESQ